MAHRKGEGHFCWERSTIEDLFREVKKDPKDLKSKSIPVKILRAMDRRLLPEWKKQLLFVTRMREICTSCMEKPEEGAREFQKEHQALHEKTWPSTVEVRGLPPPTVPALDIVRTTPPKSPLPEEAETKLVGAVMQDYPEAVLMPMHIANWLVERVLDFAGQNPEHLRCVYHEGVPSLPRTRLLVERHRMKTLVSTLEECRKGTTIRIPEKWVNFFRYGPKPHQFKGNNVEGINQTLSAALGLADKDGNPCEAKVVSSALLWAFVHYPDTWTEYYPLLSKEGHLPCVTHISRQKRNSLQRGRRPLINRKRKQRRTVFLGYHWCY